MNFFEVLLHPDREELEFKERALVCSAANVLQVGEFQLLQLAYREWFGKDLPEALVARLFTDYMLQGEVPHWARHYARLVLKRDERGVLDANDPAYHRYDHDYYTTVPRGVQRFCLAVGMLTACLVSSIVIANMTVRGSTSVLPPYFEDDEFAPIAPGVGQRGHWDRADDLPASGQR
jgi:hypothetical protein